MARRPPPPSVPPAARTRDAIDSRPRPWRDVFDEQTHIDVDGDTFCCYSAGMSRKPDVVCALLHGGGHCALSWGLVAHEIKDTCGVVAYDSRAHGSTRCADEDDLSAEVQVADAAKVLLRLVAAQAAPPRKLVLCGHSMGGAIAVRVAASGLLDDILAGLVVIDVVEGTALAALPHMSAWINRRAKSFASVAHAIEYVVKAGHVHNADSARLSVPHELRQDTLTQRWVWRTPLADTERFWHGWFYGLSQLFLSVRAAKLLVLAGVDRLDRDLTIAQMQGKFQNILIPQAGHIVQEDCPQQTARVLLEFLRRNLLVDAADDDSDAPHVYQQRRLIQP